MCPGKQYAPEKTENVYFQSDGGAWMKKGIETLCADFVLDGFHIHEYKKDGTPGRGYRRNNERKQEKKIQGWLEEGSRRKLD